MSEEASFRDLLERVRARNDEACTELWQRYEPVVRVAVRLKLNAKLRRLLDSSDVCQSVFKNFFRCVAERELHVETPAQLEQLLKAIVKNSVINHWEKLQAARRGGGRPVASITPDWEVQANQPGPEEEFERKELLEKIYRCWSAKERWLHEQRALDRSWADIASEAGDSPDALRVCLARVITRTARELSGEA